MRGGVDCCHLQGNHWVTSAGNGMAYDTVHVTLVHQCAGMAVVCAKDKAARVQAFFRHGSDLTFHVIPRRAEPHHRPHALLHPFDRIRFTGALVIISRTAGDIASERGSKIG